MQQTFLKCLAVMAFAGLLTSPLRADYLKNANLQDDYSCWHGDGERVFLKADGTEGTEADLGVTPVIKLSLSSHVSSVYQEIETRDEPTTMHVKVSVFASNDFKRNVPENAYSKAWDGDGAWYWGGGIPVATVIPNVDFWIRGGGHGWYYKLAHLTPNAWVTVEGSYQGIEKATSQIVNFLVPPGTGAVYLKNPLVGP